MVTEILLRSQTVSDSSSAALLSNPKALKNLTPFIGQEATLSQAAKSLGVSQHHLRYWVDKFLALGLLCCRSQARKGRAIKWYRASADRYFVPFQVVPGETLEELLLQNDAPWQALMARNLVQVGLDSFEGLHRWGLSIFVEGSLCVEIATDAQDQKYLHQRLLEPHAPAVLMSWLDLQLAFEDAKAFQLELCQLLEKYRKYKGRQGYLARVALTPLVRD